MNHSSSPQKQRLHLQLSDLLLLKNSKTLLFVIVFAIQIYYGNIKKKVAHDCRYLIGTREQTNDRNYKQRI